MAITLQKLFCKRLYTFCSYFTSNPNITGGDNKNNPFSSSSSSTSGDIPLFSHEELSFCKKPNPKIYQRLGDFSYVPRNAALHNNAISLF
jgi:hypothetical protein